MLPNIKCIAALFVMILTANIVSAQVLNVENETIIHDGKERNSIRVIIAPEAKEVKKAFRDFMDDRYDVDIEGIGFLTNKEVLYTEPTVVPPISPKKMELFAKVRSNGGKTIMNVFGQMGYNTPITRYDTYNEYNAMKELTIDFLNELLPNYYQDIVEDQQDRIEDLEDDRDDMLKKISKNREKIANLQKENRKLEQKVASVKEKLEQNIDELGEKKATLKNVNGKLDRANQ
ncbi:MAG: hypothetical protein AAF960_04795 [Bacteroidota bacterium]